MNEILFRQLFRVTLSLVYDVAYGQLDLDQVSMVFGLMLSRQNVQVAYLLALIWDLQGFSPLL